MIITSIKLFTHVFSASAADVFRLNAEPGHRAKELAVSASFFEIHNGNVSGRRAGGHGTTLSRGTGLFVAHGNGCGDG